MGRAPCCDKANVKRGPWSPEEDSKLKAYIEQYGTGGNWIALPQKIGLRRCGKSCRLRWLNYLRPNIKHGGFSEEEDNIICSLYMSIGSRWSIIAGQLPGRTDNDIKNYWNTKLKKKLLGKHRKDQRARSSSSLIAKRKENLSTTDTINLYNLPHQPLAALPSNVPLLDMESHLQDHPSLTNLLVMDMEEKLPTDNLHNPSNDPYSTLYPYDTISCPEGQPCSISSMTRSPCSLVPSNYSSCPIYEYGAIADLSNIPYFPVDQFGHEMNYSLDNLDVVNRSTIKSSSSESTTTWGDMSATVNYSPTGYSYQICPETFPQECILQESSNFRMQQQTVLQ